MRLFPRFSWPGGIRSRKELYIIPGTNNVGKTSTALEKDAKPSSRVTDYTFSGYDQIIRPEVDFAYSYDLYKTIGIVQNVVESFVSEIMSRDWYYVDKNLEQRRDKLKKALSKKVKQLKSKQQASLLFNSRYAPRMSERI